MANQDFELSAQELRQVCETSVFDFKSTEELPVLKEVIGQDRAVRAVTFGIEMERPGYHMYALGPAGTGKTTTIKKFLERKAADEPVPDDWCYVNNFKDSDRPHALRLPAGRGTAFRIDMDEFVQELQTELPRIFESEQYRNEQEQIQEQFQKRQQQIFEELQSEAEKKNLTLVQTAHGLVVAPVVDGEALSPAKLGELDDAARGQIEEKQQELEEDMREARRRVQRLQKQAKEQIRDLDRQVVSASVEHFIEELKEKHKEFDPIIDFLEEVRADILDNVQEFKKMERAKKTREQLPLPTGPGAQQPSFDQYRVNLMVDNSGLESAPVILETNPIHHNLVGRIEHRAQYGALVTDFRMIKAGALHRANGGYLIIETIDLLTKPFAWDTLKRALRNEEIKIEIMGEGFQVISTRTLEPEPIPLNIKVVLIGDPRYYYLLYQLDEDFQELFRVKADFGTHMSRSSETAHQYAQFIGNVCREEKLTHFDPSGVAKIVEYGSRLISDQKKLATKFGDVVDLIRESHYWAQKNGNHLVQAGDVEKAIDEKIYRSNRIEELIQEMFDEGTLLIDTTGEVVGQVNGISVVSLGDYAFGKPSRITAQTHVGTDGLVNIDRETELGGRIHNKGVMILAGYLGGKFARDNPMALSASITFEQLYEEVEGDSAASAELYALLSSLSGIPIKQNIAVTGSVNQRGQVQAIGGVNEKIEGFFDVCKSKGLTGEQGVLIPRSNVKNLMLREEVVDAVRNGQFHLYAVSSIDEGIEALTGKTAGEVQPDGSYPDGTVNDAVQKRLRELARKVKEFRREHGVEGAKV